MDEVEDLMDALARGYKPSETLRQLVQQGLPHKGGLRQSAAAEEVLDPHSAIGELNPLSGPSR